MKSNTMKTVRAFFSAAILLFGLSAFAQNLAQRPWTVSVPFDFKVRGINLEAGRYTVSKFGSSIQLTSQKGKSADALVNVDYRPQPSEHSSLVFKFDGNEYALTQINTVGSKVQFNMIPARHAPKQLETSTGLQVAEVTVVGTR